MLGVKLLLISTLVLGLGWYTFKYQYYPYCNRCVQRCLIFSAETFATCLSKCFCPNLELHIKSHKNDFTVLNEERGECSQGYSSSPKIEPKQTPKNATKPNIVVILLDDQDELISPYFDAMPFSKELFQQNGTHFTKGFTSTAYCCPARCQLLTGTYGHSNGVIAMQNNFASVNAFRRPLYQNGTRQKIEGKCVNNENQTISLFLQKHANYYTSIFGKYINEIENDVTHQIDYIPTGWDEFHIYSDKACFAGYKYVMTNWTKADGDNIRYEYFGTSDSDYVTDITGQKVVEVIDRQRKGGQTNDQPLFLYIAPTAPHFPMVPAERHRKYIEVWREKFDQYVSSRPNYNSHESVQSKSSWLKDQEKGRDEFFNNSELRWHELEWEKRMSSLYAVDEMIKSIYDKFRDIGELENTVFVFASDNGYNMGAHKLFHKFTPYDESVRIPFYISGPGFTKNSRDDQLVLLNDLAPTFLDLAGLKIPDHMDGQSLVPGSNKKRSGILLEYKNSKFHDFYDNFGESGQMFWVKQVSPDAMVYDTPPYIALRTPDYLLIEYSDLEQHKEHELYDLTNDASQMKNIFGDEKFRTLKDDLLLKLHQLSVCSGRECLI